MFVLLLNPCSSAKPLLFACFQVDSGPSGAIYGLFGVLLIDLFQSWQVVPKPWKELQKLLALIVVSLLIGTLPSVDNFAHMAGLCFGAVTAVVFLPYITFG
eukprot:m.236607 g.236607  ORF g.236607 m.236607 type:complete len:101 (-) comp22491_c1_seq24:335-637(-)